MPGEEVRHLSLDEALAIHERLIERFGGSPGVRDLGLLESALYRPQTGYYSDLAEMAAAGVRLETVNALDGDLATVVDRFGPLPSMSVRASMYVAPAATTRRWEASRNSSIAFDTPYDHRGLDQGHGDCKNNNGDPASRLAHSFTLLLFALLLLALFGMARQNNFAAGSILRRASPKLRWLARIPVLPFNVVMASLMWT